MSSPELDATAPDQSFGRDWAGGTLAWAIVIAWFIAIHAYWTPAHLGVDQNGYLEGGRMITEHLSTGMSPPDYFGFVSTMWIGTPWQVYYPKYPIGLPVLNAGLLELGTTRWGRAIVFMFGSLPWGLLPVGIFLILRSALQGIKPLWKYRISFTPVSLFVALATTMIAIHIRVGPLNGLKIEGPSPGVVLCYLLSPVMMALGLVATYQLVRLLAGPLGGILAMITVACSPVTLELANNPNSHASTFFCVTWGMFLLVRWWQSQGAWRAVFAGLLLGYAVTIRYTEGMLLLPIVVVAIFNLRIRSVRSWVETGLLLAWWAIPVMCLVGFNLGAFGAVTGYDSTNESTGFTWLNFQSNWETTVRSMYNTGLIFILPVSLAGLFVMFIKQWRMALFLSSWIVPSLILYSAYYWAPDNKLISFMRFFLTILPPLALAAYWLLLNVLPLAFSHGGDSLPLKRNAIVSVATVSVFAAISLFVLLMTIGDIRWQRANPHVFETTGAQMTKQQARKVQNGKLAAVAPPTHEAAAEERDEELKDDKIRLSNGFQFAMLRFPLLGGGMLVLLACVYAVAYHRSNKSMRVFGAGSIASGAACAGLLTLANAGMNLYQAGPDMETNLYSMMNSSISADLLANNVAAPDGSIVFGDDKLLNHLQFIGDYQIYDVHAFSTAAISKLSPENFDPNQPNPKQEERAADLFKMVGRYTETQLVNEHHKIVREALSHGKHVYAIVPMRQLQMNAFTSYFPATMFKIVRRAEWQEPLPAQPREPRRSQWLGVGGAFSPPPATKNIEPVLWAIVEILPAPPAPPKPPVSRPSKLK